MNETTALNHSPLDPLAQRAANTADDAIAATKRAANGALDSLQGQVDDLRAQGSGALGRAAAQVDELTRRGVEAARQAGAGMQAQVHRASDRTVDYVRDEPVKAMLVAAAAGAALAALISLAMRPREPSRG